MKNSILFSFSVIAVCIVFFSCNNSSTDKKSENDSEEKTKIEVKYLEDFAQFDNHEELVDYFGEDNVVETERYMAEGTEKYLVSIVYPDNKNKIIVYWKQNSNDYEDYDFVEALYSAYDSDWEMTDEEGETYPIECGLQTNCTLQELEAENGAPFGFYGMGWDYAGYTFDLNSKFDDYHFVVGCPAMDYTSEFPEEYYNILGDQEFFSDDEAAKLVDLRVVSISYTGK
jgi:hypothetical protein